MTLHPFLSCLSCLLFLWLLRRANVKLGEHVLNVQRCDCWQVPVPGLANNRRERIETERTAAATNAYYCGSLRFTAVERIRLISKRLFPPRMGLTEPSWAYLVSHREFGEMLMAPRQTVRRSVSEAQGASSGAGASEATAAVRDVRDILANSIDRSVARRPYTTLTLAFGFGFMLGALWAR